MRLQSLQVSLLEIPFKSAFKHASADRRAGCSLWVEARDMDGTAGYGEGCPRSYVTGESFDTARGFVARHRAEWMACLEDLDSLLDWADVHRGEIDANPVAWAACELALLDLMGKTRGVPVETLIGLEGIAGTFRYTAVLGDADPDVFEAQLSLYRKAGFTKFKIKLSGELSRDLAKVNALMAAGIRPGAVRADANNLWCDAATALTHLEALQFPFHALEEPLRAGDYENLRALSGWVPGRIILDESLLRSTQVEPLARDPQRWVVNIRVSKMGGLLRSLEVLRTAQRLGIPVVLGAHVGETSLLTRAALPLAREAGDLLLGHEGACGTHLLEHDLFQPPLMFAAAGVLDTARYNFIAAPGFGLTIDLENHAVLQPLA